MDTWQELRKSRLFNEINDSDWKIISQVFQPLTIPEGEEFIAENSIEDELYIIVKGSAEVFMSTFRTDGAKKIPIARLRPMDVIGEFVLASPGRRRSASARAVTPIECFKAQGKILMQTFGEHPRIGMLLYRNLFCATVDRLADTSLQLRNAVV